MTTVISKSNVNLEIDNGLDHGSVFSRDELIGKLAVLEADIKAKKKEQEELRQYAVDAGIAKWKLSNEGKLTPKAPAMGWWTTHRAASFAKQCEATEDPKHPEHSCFWAKPRKTFSL
jgi:hypothetical protein|tara:strand:+ start:112 stop:462 length:351 start_codon:yes stop_codon:yes gene_type:complete